MAELSIAKLNQLVKSNPEITQSAAAERLNVPIGKLSMLVFCQAKVAAQPSLKAPQTPTSVKKLRDGGDRWELIAARTGLGVAAVKAAYEQAGGDPTAYVGRGRNFSGTATKTRSGSKTKAASKKTTAGRSGSKKTTAARAGSKKTAARAGSKKTAGVKRNLTGRRSQAGNPS